MIKQLQIRPSLSVLAAICALTVIFGGTATAATLDPQTINSAKPGRNSDAKRGLDPLTVKIQILLDRAHFSPGEIDGKDGENFKKALSAFAAAQGSEWQRKWTDDLWPKLTTNAPDDLLMNSTIRDQDIKESFLDRVPAKMEDMKDRRGSRTLRQERS